MVVEASKVAETQEGSVGAQGGGYAFCGSWPSTCMLETGIRCPRFNTNVKGCRKGYESSRMRYK